MEKSEATNMGFTVESFFIILVTVLIIVCNVLVLCVVFLTDRMDSINKYFFVSLTVSDLAVGMFVAPFSIWPSIAHKWMFGTKFCHMEAYLAAIFWIASIYSLMWISIDHYVAIRKPDRYESLMTPMKCLCWVALVWVAALSFCCPPLFAESRARYYQEAFICIIDWNFQRAYIITSGTLVVVPPIIALVVSNSYIFTATYRQKRIIYEKCTESNSRPEHYFTNMIICCVFLVTWLPWCSLQMHDVIHNNSTPSGPPALHFYLMWLAVGNSIWKFLMYVIFDHDFRIGLKIMYLRMSCSDWNT